MGVIYDCFICGGQAGEFDTFDKKPICKDCKNKALEIGVKILQEVQMVELNLSERIGEIIGEDGFRKNECIEVKDIKEFIKRCEELSIPVEEDITGKRWISMETLKSLAGDKLTK